VNLLDRLKREALICDGAMGTQIAATGKLEAGTSPDCLNVESPETILAIHKSYVEAGADILLTNTFGANCLRLAASGLQEKAHDIVRAGVRIARKAAPEGVFVFGDMGSTGSESNLPPYGTANEKDFTLSFREEAVILAEEGVDALLIETFSFLKEALLAVRAAKAATSLPVLCSMTFKKPAESAADDFRTFWGDDLDSIVNQLTDAGVDGIGANCGELVEEMPRIAELYKSKTDLPIIIEPNAGRPVLDKNKNVSYPMTPAEMGLLAEKIRNAGANIIGGCCGTGPEHIRAIRDALK
jgi:5-methyltetrahydrofolate--homocysteine methyltransferase